MRAHGRSAEEEEIRVNSTEWVIYAIIIHRLQEKMGGTETEKIRQVPIFQMNGRGNDWESWCMTASNRIEGNKMD